MIGKILFVKYINRILVLENGRMVEFDTPSELLKIENGIFKELYDKSNL